MAAWKLTAPANVSPGLGEDLGETLALAADAFLERLKARTGGGIPDMDRRNVATLYRLAAQAYDTAKGASIGHQRRDRYAVRADGLRLKADDLEARTI